MFGFIGQICLLSVMAGASGADAPDSDPRAWLERMTNTVQNQSYEGTFVHIINGEAVESMRIIHKVTDGQISERLVSLDGSGREIIRNDDEVRCILQEEKTVVVERPEASSFLSPLAKFQTGLENFYDFKMVGRSRVANRDTRVFEVLPRDEFRYGHRLSLDEQTGMPLRSELIDKNGTVVEQVLFTSITLRDDITDDELQQRLPVDGYKWFVREEQSDSASDSWEADFLPEGFSLTVARTHDSKEQKRDQYVYSDGLATVSVFVEQPDAAVEPMNGLSSIGSANAYATMIDGFQVTTVGEVPPSTVKMIGTSIRRRK